MIPVSVALLPLATLGIGQVMAKVFQWPLPQCTEASWKAIFLFLQARWGFDAFFNQRVSLPVLQQGEATWASLDKGLLEWQGPRGISFQVTSFLPQVRNSGFIHDYAQVLQQVAIRGLVGFTSLLMLPVKEQILRALQRTLLPQPHPDSPFFKAMTANAQQWTLQTMFFLAALGTFQNRRNFQVMQQCIEAMLLSVNMVFQTASVRLDDVNGQLLALWVLTAAASETALGQALCVQYFRLRSTLDVELISQQKG